MTREQQEAAHDIVVRCLDDLRAVGIHPSDAGPFLMGSAIGLAIYGGVTPADLRAVLETCIAQCQNQDVGRYVLTN